MKFVTPILLGSAVCAMPFVVLAADTTDYATAYALDPNALVEPAYVEPREVETKALVTALRNRMASAPNFEDRLAVLDDLTPTEWNALTVALFRIDACQIGDLPNGLIEAKAALFGLSTDDVWPMLFRLNTGMTPAFKRFADAGQTEITSISIKLIDCE